MTLFPCEIFLKRTHEINKQEVCNGFCMPYSVLLLIMPSYSVTRDTEDSRNCYVCWLYNVHVLAICGTLKRAWCQCRRAWCSTMLIGLGRNTNGQPIHTCQMSSVGLDTPVDFHNLAPSCTTCKICSQNWDFLKWNLLLYPFFLMTLFLYKLP